MNEDKGRGVGARLAKTLSGIEANELKATLVSTLFVLVQLQEYMMK